MPNNDFVSRLKKIVSEIDRDRSTHFLTGSVTFNENDFSTKTIIFNVPKQRNFYAYSFYLLPYVRKISIDSSVGGGNDLVFAPAMWAATLNLQQISTNSVENIYGVVDAVWELSFSRLGESIEYQNSPCSIPSTYCATSGDLITSDPNLANPFALNYEQSALPSGMVFDCPLYLPGGSTCSCRVTPTYTDECLADGRKNQFQIQGILSGTYGDAL